MGNRIGYPDITLLPQIAEELGISIEQLFGKEPEWEQEEITAEPFLSGKRVTPVGWQPK